MLKLKTRNKINANTVGVAPWATSSSKIYSNPNSKIQTLISNPKGITLIALIITIIVMLILVGVTVNVALSGGLFEKAKTAAKQTEEQVILEQIIELAEWDNNGKIKVKETVENVVKRFGNDKVTPNTVDDTQTEVTVEV